MGSRRLQVQKMNKTGVLMSLALKTAAELTYSGARPKTGTATATATATTAPVLVAVVATVTTATATPSLVVLNVP